MTKQPSLISLSPTIPTVIADCIPFYDHGNLDADPGWGIAAWTITDWFSDYYADE